MAPERISGKLSSEDFEMCKRCDMWSIGIIIYVLFSGKFPFNGENSQQLYENIRKCDLKFDGIEWELVP